MSTPTLRNTEEAIAYGLGLDAAGIERLREELAGADTACRAWMQPAAEVAQRTEAEWDAVLAVIFRAQLLREALEAATGTGGIGEMLRREPARISALSPAHP